MHLEEILKDLEYKVRGVGDLDSPKDNFLSWLEYYRHFYNEDFDINEAVEKLDEDDIEKLKVILTCVNRPCYDYATGGYDFKHDIEPDLCSVFDMLDVNGDLSNWHVVARTNGWKLDLFKEFGRWFAENSIHSPFYLEGLDRDRATALETAFDEVFDFIDFDAYGKYIARYNPVTFFYNDDVLVIGDGLF